MARATGDEERGGSASGTGLRVYLGRLDPGQREALVAGRVVEVDDPALAEVVVAPGVALVPPGLGQAGLGDQFALTPREDEILGYLADGWSNYEIASRLRISTATVKFHLVNLYAKLGVGRRTEAVREGYRLGMVEL